jgi:hypothetical protein
MKYKFKKQKSIRLSLLIFLNDREYQFQIHQQSC